VQINSHINISFSRYCERDFLANSVTVMVSDSLQSACRDITAEFVRVTA